MPPTANVNLTLEENLKGCGLQYTLPFTIMDQQIEEAKMLDHVNQAINHQFERSRLSTAVPGEGTATYSV